MHRVDANNALMSALRTAPAVVRAHLDWAAVAEIAPNSRLYKVRIARLVHTAAVEPLGDVLLRPQDVLQGGGAPRGLQAPLDAGLRI